MQTKVVVPFFNKIIYIIDILTKIGWNIIINLKIDNTTLKG